MISDPGKYRYSYKSVLKNKVSLLSCRFFNNEIALFIYQVLNNLSTAAVVRIHVYPSLIIRYTCYRYIDDDDDDDDDDVFTLSHFPHAFLTMRLRYLYN